MFLLPHYFVPKIACTPLAEILYPSLEERKEGEKKECKYWEEKVESRRQETGRKDEIKREKKDYLFTSFFVFLLLSIFTRCYHPVWFKIHLFYPSIFLYLLLYCIILTTYLYVRLVSIIFLFFYRSNFIFYFLFLFLSYLFSQLREWKWSLVLTLKMGGKDWSWFP